ncbi:hypothetical protein CRUP_031734 [Coryphaenoides rupestris]|nr:hypothetical protein CRUP_031734 [Coryphaenoides rupestris]
MRWVRWVRGVRWVRWVNGTGCDIIITVTVSHLVAGRPLKYLGLKKTGAGQTVQTDSVKWGFVGQQVELRCIFANSNPPVKISQVTWQKVTNTSKQNVAIANPALGVSVLAPFRERVAFKHAAVLQSTPSLEDTTIVFKKLQLSDDGAYICEYTTFPTGNRENMVNLSVFAPPQTARLITSVSTCLSVRFPNADECH